MAAQKLTTKAAIEKVMTGSRKPMTVTEVFEAAHPLTNLKGATPKQTFYSIMYGENKKADGLVTKVEGGFKLNPKRKKADALKAEPRKRTPRASKASEVSGAIAEAIQQAEV